jgi:hypothetical protein
MKPEFIEGDILIRRATNGWIVFSHCYDAPDGIQTLLYEESGMAFDEAEAFIRLIKENFYDILQSKKQGGVKLEIAQKGHGEE